MQHSYLRNIAAFLQACRSKFNIGDADLFSDSDLYDVDNFQKVSNLNIWACKKLCEWTLHTIGNACSLPSLTHPRSTQPRMGVSRTLLQRVR